MNRSSVIRIVAFLIVVAALAALTGCGGGSGTTTLRGTFTDLDYDFIPGQSCQALEAQANSGYRVTVAVDNIPAASVAVIWHGGAYATQGTTACVGTWAAKVTTAKVAYQIRMTGNGGFGFRGTDDVSPASASQVIALTSAAG